MRLTMSRARFHPRWRDAYAQAAAELKMPERAPAGSPENIVRMELGPRVAARAREILERGELRAVPNDTLGDNAKTLR